MKRKTKKVLGNVFTLYIPLLLFLVITLAPFAWILLTSFKPSTDIMASPLKYWPNPFILDNYKYIFSTMGFGRYFTNSFVVAAGSTIIVVFLSLLGGYAMSRYKFKGKAGVYALLLITQMFPSVVLMMPLFQMYVKLHLINNLWSLILTYAITNLPFCLITMMGFYTAVPPTLEEAAQMDGCSLLGAIFKILVPTLLPGIIATGVFAFVNAWNNFVYALNFITDKDKYTISVALSMLKGEFNVDYASLSAACVVALIPVVLLFCFIQKYLVGGLAGAVKG